MEMELEKLCAELRERRQESNANRKMLPEVREQVRESGVARVLQPAPFGGSGGPISGVVDAMTQIGAACGSSGWIIAQYILHNYMVAQWPAEGQDAVWGRDPKALVSGILIPSMGSYEVVDGGYKVTGRWPWVTGVDTCDWYIVTAYEKDKPGLDTHRHFLLRREQGTIHDVWHAVGLRGSGTNDVELKELFVPEHLSLSMANLKGGESPGGHWKDEAMYTLPSYSVFGLGISGGTVGIACEIARHYNAVVKKKASVMSEKSVLDFSSQHIKFAEAKCAIDSAVEMLKLAANEFHDIAYGQARVPTDGERARCRGLATFAAHTAIDASKAIWSLSGASSVMSGNPLSGLYTDLMVAGQHFTNNKDANFKSYGRTLFGLELDNPTL